MTPEEFERLKQEEKEHLRKLKELKDQARGLSRQASVRRALDDMVHGGDEVQHTHEEMLDRVRLDAARDEARLEMGLESEQRHSSAEAADRERAEEELRQIRARRLVEEMKALMGAAPPEPSGARSTPERPPAVATPPATDPAGNEPDPLTPSRDLPEKTIGRMRPD